MLLQKDMASFCLIYSSLSVLTVNLMQNLFYAIPALFMQRKHACIPGQKKINRLCALELNKKPNSYVYISGSVSHQKFFCILKYMKKLLVFYYIITLKVKETVRYVFDITNSLQQHLCTSSPCEPSFSAHLPSYLHFLFSSLYFQILIFCPHPMWPFPYG